jgi:hypothetical protein
MDVELDVVEDEAVEAEVELVAAVEVDEVELFEIVDDEAEAVAIVTVVVVIVVEVDAIVEELEAELVVEVVELDDVELDDVELDDAVDDDLLVLVVVEDVVVVVLEGAYQSTPLSLSFDRLI